MTIGSDMNEPTTHSGDGRLDPIIPPSLEDQNLPPNPVNILANLGVVHPVTRQCDKSDSPLSPVPSELSSISRAPMDLGTVQGWDTSLDVGTFSTDGHGEIFPDSSPSSTRPPLRNQQRKLSMVMFFPQKETVSWHTCQTCGQLPPAGKTPHRSVSTETPILSFKL